MKRYLFVVSIIFTIMFGCRTQHGGDSQAKEVIIQNSNQTAIFYSVTSDGGAIRRGTCPAGASVMTIETCNQNIIFTNLAAIENTFSSPFKLQEQNLKSQLDILNGQYTKATSGGNNPANAAVSTISSQLADVGAKYTNVQTILRNYASVINEIKNGFIVQAPGSSSLGEAQTTFNKISNFMADFPIRSAIHIRNVSITGNQGLCVTEIMEEATKKSFLAIDDCNHGLRNKVLFDSVALIKIDGNSTPGAWFNWSHTGTNLGPKDGHWDDDYKHSVVSWVKGERIVIGFEQKIRGKISYVDFCPNNSHCQLVNRSGKVSITNR